MNLSRNHERSTFSASDGALGSASPRKQAILLRAQNLVIVMPNCLNSYLKALAALFH